MFFFVNNVTTCRVEGAFILLVSYEGGETAETRELEGGQKTQ